MAGKLQNSSQTLVTKVFPTFEIVVLVIEDMLVGCQSGLRLAIPWAALAETRQERSQLSHLRHTTGWKARASSRQTQE